MGPTGSGKTTVGQVLAAKLGWTFADGDDFHPGANVEKMRRGVPLDDEDRAPWLTAIREAMEGWQAAHKNVVVACSALKRAYRERLQAGPAVTFVYLRGSETLLRERLRGRQGHFADERLLASQLTALEEPATGDAVTVDVAGTPEAIASEIIARVLTRI